MADEQEANRLAVELQMLQSRGETIKQQLQQLQQAIMEINSSLETLKNIKKMKGSVLVPAGAGVFLSCSKIDDVKVIFNAGANIMVQKKAEDVVKVLEDRQASLNKSMIAAQADLTEVVRNIEQLTEKANMMAVEAGKNVRSTQKQAD